MKTKSKKVFGIDICKNTVSFAQLQKDGSQIKVLRYGNVSIEQDAVNNGVVQRPAELTRAMKRLKIAGVFEHTDAVLTICAEPVLLQILNLSDSSPGETKKFIQNEIKQYAVLPLKDVEMDYCGLRSSDAQTKRVLVGAGQTEHLNKTVKAIGKNNIEVKAIEPAILAFIRACFNKVIKTAGEKNIMLLLVRDDTLNLCVFEKQRLEFLRTKKFEAYIVGSPQQSDWLRSEVESVIRFYEVEKGTKAQSWRIVVACCPQNSSSVHVADEIRSRIPRQDIEIAAFENSLMNVTAEANDDREISPVAVGAAMKLLDEGAGGIKLNLLPEKIIKSKKAEKELLVITNVAAGLLVFMLLLVVFLGQKSIKVGDDIGAMKQKQSQVSMIRLVRLKKGVDEKMGVFKDNLAAIQKVAEDKKYYNWAELLAELAGATPKAVYIENLQGDNGLIKISGFAIGYEAINEFVGLLGQNKQISSASLVSAGKNTTLGKGLIDYSIMCSLAR